MKKLIFLFALVLGISGLAVAQSCGGGYYGSNSGTSYYNSFDAVGKVKIRKRGFEKRRWVVEANIIKGRNDGITLEYVFANGGVLTVMGKKQRHGGGQHDDFDNAYANGASNNYYYGASNGPRRNRGGTFEVHCVQLNGRTIANNCGTIRIEKGYGRMINTFINVDMGRRGKWKGNAKVRRGGRY